MASIRKLQIQAYEAQLMLTAALRDEAEDDSLAPFPMWRTANHILSDMLLAGYAPRYWGRGLAAFCETGDETPEQIKELDEIDWE